MPCRSLTFVTCLVNNTSGRTANQRFSAATANFCSACRCLQVVRLVTDSSLTLYHPSTSTHHFTTVGLEVTITELDLRITQPNIDADPEQQMFDYRAVIDVCMFVPSWGRWCHRLGLH
ncbi:hypothetical protein DFH29DRAFT_297484 [Suillus ampliporus]|nr:hypothetical protein DFH29DRAFT_297484 [Suillus ampliporus]